MASGYNAGPSTSPSRRSIVPPAALAFVLSLCIPYVEASPLPSPLSSTDTLSPPAGSSIERVATGAVHLSKRIASAVVQMYGRNNEGIGVTTPNTSSTRPRIITLAKTDVNGYYKVPADYVVLVQRFNGGFIVLSYAIAFVGSLCTLELLIRRTTNSGWKNQALLAMAGITFGGVSTFAMHFIFNNSLTLHSPNERTNNAPTLHLAYNAGFTVLSLVSSCLAMIIAFFIMGTTLDDWRWVPGMKSKRRKSRSNRRGSSYSDTSKYDVDEYGAWKDSRKVLRRGTVGMGALLNKASSVAKWSLMDMGTKSPAEGAGAGKSYGKSKKTDSTDVKQDKKLEELDFRLGPAAVKQELEKRKGSSGTQSLYRSHPHLQTSPTDSILHTQQAVRHISSDASLLPREPMPVVYPSYRRGSMPTVNDSSLRSIMATPERASTGQESMFTPGFNFPPRSEADATSSTTHLLQQSTPSHPLDSRWSDRDDIPSPPSSAGWNANRRASLPVSALVTPTYTPTRPNNVLARIQSLPEGEQDPEDDDPYKKKMSMAQSDAQPRSVLRNSTSDAASQHTDSKGRRGSADSGCDSEDEDEIDAVGGRTTPKRVEFAKPQFTKIERFLGIDVVTRLEVMKVFITGTIAGFGVAGMHYIGQLSISGMPYIAYKAEYVVGSIIIASGAVVIALYILFIMLRPKLKHNWASKIGVAVILAIAVCAMHFCGMMGTIYAWPRGQRINPQSLLLGTNKVITAVVACLAFAACIGCAVFFVLHSIKLRRERARRRRVVVAAIFMDQQDRVLVNSTDGMLPMCDIANLSGLSDSAGSKRSSRSTNGSTISDASVLGMDLTPGHDAFVSAMKMSWSWRNPSVLSNSVGPATIDPNTMNDSNSGQSATLAGTLAEIRRGSLITMESSLTGSRAVRLSVSKFLERFAVSSGQLAVQLLGQQDGISRLGVLYDQILTTGWVKLSGSNDTVSKGQLIFLVRRVTSSAERADLLSRHYIFAEAQAVASTLHKTLSVPIDHTMPLLDDMRVFCDTQVRSIPKPAILYAGVAVVQATPFDGLRILLDHNNRSQLPMRELCNILPEGSSPDDELSGTLQELGEAITWLEGMSLLSIMARNMNTGDDEASQVGGPRVQRLLRALERAIVPMLDSMLDSEDMEHILPRLHLHPVLVPLTPATSARLPGAGGTYTAPYIVVFYANYDAAVNTFTDKWLPFSLFRTQNACVMAQRIQLANRLLMDQYNDSDDGGWRYQRRPSKVQFEFPTSNPSPASTPKEPISPGVLFSEFTFPPKAEDEASRGQPAVTPVMVSNGRRRSSMVAKPRSSADQGYMQAQSQYQAMGNEKSNGSTGGTSLAPGLADWDPEWLLDLLRQKLRTEG